MIARMLQCNLDARGKKIRLIYGVAMVLAGIVLMVFWAGAKASTRGWIVSIGCIVGGAFAIFEARAGWCIVRAMGFRTRS